MPNALIDPSHDPGRVTRVFAEGSSLLALLIGVLVWVGWLFSDLRLGVALFATANLAVLSAFLWMFGRSLRRIHKEREEAEADLRHSEERFRVLVTASSQILWSTDPSGMVVGDLPSWRAYTGQTLAEVQGLGCLNAIHADDRQRTAAAWEHAVAHRRPYEVQYRIRRHDGVYRHFAVRGVPVTENGIVREWIGSCTDITGRVEIERMKDEFVRTVSHELRTPLASLRGFAELMLTRDFPPQKRHEFVSIIHRESKRLANLINDFLDLQRIEAGQQRLRLEDFDARGLLAQAAELFAPSAPQHQFRIVAETGLCVRGDLERSEQVVANLVSNAIKYSPAGGSIELAASRIGGEVRFEVCDEGMGIAPEKIPQLFSKFYRVDNAASREIGGTGLGLALVKQLVELQGGVVGVDSEPGAGSTFWFTLPVSQPAAPAAKPKAETVDILLAEDDLAFADLLREHFEQAGLSLLTTAYGERALELAHTARPRLILIDIYLRGAVDGWELLMRLKSDPVLHDIPAIVVTVSEPDVRGIVLGGADYVSKTGDPALLRAAVRRHLKALGGRRVLIADDDPILRRRLVEHVRSQGDFEITEAADGAEAIACIERQMPDLLLLDLLMPNVDGFEVLRRLRADPRAVDLQVLVVTGRDLTPAEQTHIRRSMATLIGKREATLDYFTEIVTKTLGAPVAEPVV